jgi:hypothetical protein
MKPMINSNKQDPTANRMAHNFRRAAGGPTVFANSEHPTLLRLPVRSVRLTLGRRRHFIEESHVSTGST